MVDLKNLYESEYCFIVPEAVTFAAKTCQNYHFPFKKTLKGKGNSAHSFENVEQKHKYPKCQNV